MDNDNNQNIRKRINKVEDEVIQPLLKIEDEEKIHKPVATTKKALFDKKATITLVLLTLISLATRYYGISKSDIVVWDEAHFGLFASEYIKRTFYFDVHPPLGKMLIALAGWLCGYNGLFGWDSGEKYPEEVNYVFMRIYCATFGALLVPLAYLTAKELHYSKLTCLLVATMVICENALITISKFILLDPFLLFFTALAFYCLTRFKNARSNPFSLNWWLSLAATGASIGMVSSVKWVGLFSVALVGLYTIWELWDYIGKPGMKITTYIGHWIARILLLIILPISIYAFNFYIHFTVLKKTGSGDAQMSSLFQAGLEGIDFTENPLHIAYNSKVTIKNSAYGGGLLHSHIQRYPTGTGSEQQQVTCYHHKDGNNEWIIKKPWDSQQVPEDTVRYLKDGDIIRLVHSETKRNLHSHKIKGPITTSMYEVSGYGNATVGDANDHWKIEIVKDLHDKSGNIHALLTSFRLRHVNTGCLLHSGGATLPQWGFKQAEVVCDKHNNEHSANNIWNVESHWNPLLPVAPAKIFRASFFNNLIDINVAMWTSNNSLVPDEDKEPDNLTSKPWQWPLALVGIRMCSWEDNVLKFYLIGNPFIWWSIAAVIIFTILLSFCYILLNKCGVLYWSTDEWDNYWYTAIITILGWALHYFPSYIMGRVLYLHHYFPAVYFGIFIIAFAIEHINSYFKKAKFVGNAIIILYAIIVFAFFVYFAPFTYGFEGSSNRMKSKQWLKTWSMADEDGLQN